MVFQDGGGYVNPNGDFRVPTVFDNLIAAKEMPVTIGVFINPGVVPPPEGDKDAKGRDRTAVSSTTPSPISTSAFWRRRSCRRSPRTTS